MVVGTITKLVGRDGASPFTTLSFKHHSAPNLAEQIQLCSIDLEERDSSVSKKSLTPWLQSLSWCTFNYLLADVDTTSLSVLRQQILSLHSMLETRSTQRGASRPPVLPASVCSVEHPNTKRPKYLQKIYTGEACYTLSQPKPRILTTFTRNS